jgi:hypothetical protein
MSESGFVFFFHISRGPEKKNPLIIFLKIKKKYDVHKPPCTNGKSGALTQKSIE